MNARINQLPVKWPALALILCAKASLAQQLKPVEPGTQSADSGRGSQLFEQMFQREEPRGFARYPEDVDDYLDQLNGIYLQLSSTTVYQHASSSKTSRKQLLTTNYNIAGAWRPLPGGHVSWWLTGGTPIGGSGNANLSEEIGSLLKINGSRETDKAIVGELYWSQRFGGRFRYSLGCVDSSQRYDFNDAANDDNANFLSLSLINSPVIPFPDPALSADLLWQHKKRIAVHLGLYQSNCPTSSHCLDELSADDVFAPIEFIYRTNIRGIGTGNYRLMAFYSSKKNTAESSDNGLYRERIERGAGYSISIDQAIGPLTPFLRYSAGDRTFSDFQRFISTGVEWTRPLGQAWNAIGLGYAHGKPSDGKKREESTVELYWRFQLNPYVALTPDIQWVLNPADNPADNRVTIAGLRLQLDF